MRFRPCIDIHNGKVKQIVGSTLKDEGDVADENFVSQKDSAYYAGLYRDKGLFGGHVIILNPKDSEYYEDTKRQAIKALETFPNGMMLGGGVDDRNAMEFIECGASHVIVTSYVFNNGHIDFDRLKRISDTVGREHLCIDLSCRKRGNGYVVVTDRWQRFTDEKLTGGLLDRLSVYASEYLVHAVDTEGKQKGIEDEVIPVLMLSPVPVTYAGGIAGVGDIKKLRELGGEKIDFTVGSALKLFGGNLELEEIQGCIQ